MTKKATVPVGGQVSSGTVHKIPSDLRKVLASDKVALAEWESLTSLARNEWICWVTFVKKEETRKEHVNRVITELKEGKRRPCCWAGCSHRTDRTPRLLDKQRKTKASYA